MEQLPDYLTVKEVATVVRVHPGTVRRWREDGTLPGVRVGGTIRFRRQDVEALLGVVSTPEPAEVA